LPFQDRSLFSCPAAESIYTIIKQEVIALNIRNPGQKITGFSGFDQKKSGMKGNIDTAVGVQFLKRTGSEGVETRKMLLLE